MKPWIDFYDLAKPDLPNCPDGALDSALRQSAIDFCEQSFAWRYEHPSVAVTVGTSQYEFGPPSGAVVHAITYAKFNDNEIEVGVDADHMRIWKWRDQTGTPQYVLGGDTNLTLVPNPDIEGTLTMIVVLKPSPDAESVDDFLFNEYRETIVHGAKARLMLSPKKPYGNPEMSVYHQAQFIAKTGAAGTRVARNYTRAPLQTSIMRR